MMPLCEHRKCKRVAVAEARLLRLWDSYNSSTAPNHVQNIWLCIKHLKKVNKMLNIKDSPSDK